MRLQHYPQQSIEQALQLTRDWLATTPAAAHWSQVGVRPHHGFVIPLFALHSQGKGIGTYNDLIPLIYWCQELGFDVIQLLPLNDTGHDTSPYSALSAFALNPIHLDLAALPYVETNAALQALLAQEPTGQPEQLRVDYPSVRQFKEDFLRRYLQIYAPILNAEPAVQTFLKTTPWLEGYALYKSLKAAHDWQAWEHWSAEARDPSPSHYQLLLQQWQGDISHHSLVQYLCWSQWQGVRAAAEAAKVLLKGDLPILINRDSADVWLHRSCFNLELTAGAPPDVYRADGQSWGVPLYRWQEAQEPLYAWWQQRLHSAALLYHLYRLDHLVGFFRIWAIPPGHTGREGFYLPPSWNLWIPQGEQRMRQLLTASTLFPIAEDLGAVPQQVRACLQRLGICGTKVMRWERTEGELAGAYLDPRGYPLLSLTTVSTHDTETLRQWWSSAPAAAQLLCSTYGWDYQSQLTPATLAAILRLSHHSGSLWHISLLAEYMGLFPELHWPESADERINYPGTYSDTNWSVRLRPSVEELIAHRPLAAALRHLLTCPPSLG